ncbi:hypothetical protein ACFPT7_02085 [Acidicapsa dinghuensis]|uniref:Uncharacterized protein n=1 Tax=Acidicapsa dinghuensis TaxID=2218256 RepID=A0ABW1EA08_9BACT|nr:hypothetical protein [Acidicapsa dinghuensis]
MKNTRVFDVDSKGRYTLKFSQVEKRVADCLLAWVVKGVSFRKLTPAEAVRARNEAARLREPLPFAELPGLLYRPAAGREAGTRLQRTRAVEANRFAQPEYAEQSA